MDEEFSGAMETNKKATVNQRVCPESEELHENSKSGVDLSWPFLLRFPVNAFGVPMGVCSQSIVWRNLSTYPSMRFLHIPPEIGCGFWILGLVLLIICCAVYALKFVIWPKAVYLEFLHPVRSNFFAGPFLAGLFLVLGAPAKVTGPGDGPPELVVVHVSEAFLLTVPLILLEIHLYGHWLIGARRKLSHVANPTTQIAVVGNFISATAFALAGWRDLALALFSVGLVYQLVVFTTLYMRLSSNNDLPAPLRPSCFLFVAPPSAAAIAWSSIIDRVDNMTKIFTFIGLFFLIIMVSRVNFFFTGVRFTLSWWAYTFPLAAISIAMIKYADERVLPLPTTLLTWFPKVLACSLASFSSCALIGVLAITVHQTIKGSLFVEDEVVKSALPDQMETQKVRWSNGCFSIDCAVDAL